MVIARRKRVGIPVRRLSARYDFKRTRALAAYGLKPDTPEPEIVAHLFGLYADATKATKRTEGTKETKVTEATKRTEETKGTKVAEATRKTKVVSRSLRSLPSLSSLEGGSNG